MTASCMILEFKLPTAIHANHLEYSDYALLFSAFFGIYELQWMELDKRHKKLFEQHINP